jgi:hypothetical protein
MRPRKKPATVVPVAPLSEPDQLKDIEWVRNFLQVSRSRVFQLMKNDGLPCIKLDRTLRFHPHAVVRWAEEKQQRSA